MSTSWEEISDQRPLWTTGKGESNWCKKCHCFSNKMEHNWSKPGKERWECLEVWERQQTWRGDMIQTHLWICQWFFLMSSVGDTQEFIAQNSSRKLEVSSQEKLLVVGMQQPGHTAWSIHSMADSWKQHHHTSHCLPAWPVCESTWLYSGHTSPGRGIWVEQPSSDWFHSPWCGQILGALAQLPSSLAYLPPLPGTEVLSKDIETTGKWILPHSLHSCWSLENSFPSLALELLQAEETRLGLQSAQEAKAM